MFKAVKYFLLILSVSSCSFFSQREEIPVGYVDAFSGPRAMFGTSARNGIQMAIEEVNARGGIQGKNIKLYIYDDQGIPENAAKAAEQLIEKQKIVALIGASASSRSLLMAPIAQAKKIPMIAFSSTHPKLTQIGDYIFRACFIDTFQGPMMAEFLRKSLKLKRAAIFRDINTQYSMNISEFFKKTFTRLGGQVVSDQTYAGGSVDFTKPLRAIQKQNPEVVYIPGYYGDVAQIAIQARSMGIKAVFAGADGWDSGDLLELSKGSLEGAYFSSHFSPDSTEPTYVTFRDAFLKKFKLNPDAFSALGYDAAKVLSDAMKRSELMSPEQIRDQIALTKDFQGVTGNITLDAKRNAVKPVVILKIENNASKFVQTFNQKK